MHTWNPWEHPGLSLEEQWGLQSKNAPGFSACPAPTFGPQFLRLQNGKVRRRSLGRRGTNYSGWWGGVPYLLSRPQRGLLGLLDTERVYSTRTDSSFPASLQTGPHCRHGFITSRSLLHPANAH